MDDMLSLAIPEKEVEYRDASGLLGDESPVEGVDVVCLMSFAGGRFSKAKLERKSVWTVKR